VEAAEVPALREDGAPLGPRARPGARSTVTGGADDDEPELGK
jgi:hypothetical protein